MAAGRIKRGLRVLARRTYLRGTWFQGAAVSGATHESPDRYRDGRGNGPEELLGISICGGRFIQSMAAEGHVRANGVYRVGSAVSDPGRCISYSGGAQNA